MTRPDDAFGRVVTTPGVCSGAERFDGTRIPVATVLRLLAEWDDARILSNYPTLGPADLDTARRIAAQGAVLCTGECGRMWRSVPAEAPRPFVCMDCRAGWPPGLCAECCADVPDGAALCDACRDTEVDALRDFARLAGPHG